MPCEIGEFLHCFTVVQIISGSDDLWYRTTHLSICDVMLHFEPAFELD